MVLFVSSGGGKTYYVYFFLLSPQRRRFGKLTYSMIAEQEKTIHLHIHACNYLAQGVVEIFANSMVLSKSKSIAFIPYS